MPLWFGTKESRSKSHPRQNVTYHSTWITKKLTDRPTAMHLDPQLAPKWFYWIIFLRFTIKPTGRVKPSIYSKRESTGGTAKGNKKKHHFPMISQATHAHEVIMRHFGGGGGKFFFLNVGRRFTLGFLLVFPLQGPRLRDHGQQIQDRLRNMAKLHGFGLLRVFYGVFVGCSWVCRVFLVFPLCFYALQW